ACSPSTFELKDYSALVPPLIQRIKDMLMGRERESVDCPFDRIDELTDESAEDCSDYLNDILLLCSEGVLTTSNHYMKDKLMMRLGSKGWHTIPESSPKSVQE
ncbi:hypothetical protein PENTCL1PPCAC_17270, partial [Pristionchus entomophagus]